MRAITQKVTTAFMNGINMRSGNDSVNVENGVAQMRLHGNLIAERNIETGKVRVTNAGWYSNTTKERLNGIPGVRVNQQNFGWFLNGEAWDGSWKEI